VKGVSQKTEHRERPGEDSRPLREQEPTAERRASVVRLIVKSLVRPGPEGASGALVDGTALAALTPGRTLSMRFSSSGTRGALGAPAVEWSIDATGVGFTAEQASDDAGRLASDLAVALGASPWAPELSVGLSGVVEVPAVRSRVMLHPPSIRLATPCAGSATGFRNTTASRRAPSSVSIPAAVRADGTLDRLIGVLAHVDEPAALTMAFTPVRLLSAERDLVRCILERLQRGGHFVVVSGEGPISDDPAFVAYAMGVLTPWTLDGSGWRREVALSFAGPPSEFVARVAAEELFGGDAHRGALDEGTLDLSSLVHRSAPPPPVVPSPHRLRTCGVRTTPPVPQRLAQEGIRLGHINTGVRTVPVCVSLPDLDRHMLIVGASGTGKSVLMRHMAREAIDRGEGLCLIDPHGDLYRDVLADIPRCRADDVVCLVPGHPERTVGLNFLQVDPADVEGGLNLVTNDLLGILHTLFNMNVAGGPIFDSYLRHAVHLAGNNSRPGTLASVVWIFEDDDYRERLLRTCQSKHVVNFWKGVAERAIGDMSLRSMAPYVVSKLARFTANPVLRAMIGQRESTVDFDRVLAERKIVLMNLSVGALGTLDVRLLGMIVASKLYAAIMRRGNRPDARTPFTLCIDETQHFVTDTLGQLASESRKYGCRLVLATQALGQLHAEHAPRVRDAVVSNMGSLVVFRPGVADTGVLEVYTQPELRARDLLDLPNFEAAVRLLVDHRPVRPFVLRTEMVSPRRADARTQEIVSANFARYTRARAEVESHLLKERTAGI
jgi:hypothetical protein